MSPTRLARVALAALPLLAGAASSPPGSGAEPGKAPRVAVLPVDNLTGRALESAAIERTWGDALSARGFEVLDVPALRAVMDRHRVRYVGGVSPDLAAALRDEAHVEAALVISLERWVELDPPVLSMTARLVSTGTSPSILWAGDVGVTGEDKPGFLRLGAIHDPDVLLATAVAALASDAAGTVSGRPTGASGVERRFRPKLSYSSVSRGESQAGLHVAVLPFTNKTTRRRGGDLIASHFVTALARRHGVTVVEPGIVREVLLKLRIIPEGGIPYAQAELLRETLGADLVVLGEVLDYAESEPDGPPPVVDFTVQLLDTAKRGVAWSSFSHNTGADGVWFFEQGRIRTANALGADMAASAVDRMLAAKGHP